MTRSLEHVRALPGMDEIMRGADYADAKAFASSRDLPDFIRRMLEYEPAWLRGLYRVRGWLARALRLEHDAHVERKSRNREADLSPGGSVGFFTSRVYEPGRLWFGHVEDKHLGAGLAVAAEPDGRGGNIFHVATIVHYRQWTGPVYFNLVRPFHHLVGRAMGRYAAKADA